MALHAAWCQIRPHKRRVQYVHLRLASFVNETFARRCVRTVVSWPPSPLSSYPSGMRRHCRVNSTLIAGSRTRENQYLLEREKERGQDFFSVTLLRRVWKVTCGGIVRWPFRSSLVAFHARLWRHLNPHPHSLAPYPTQPCFLYVRRTNRGERLFWLLKSQSMESRDVCVCVCVCVVS